MAVIFEEAGSGADLTMRALFASAAERNRVVELFHAIEGGNHTRARLDAYLSTMEDG